MSKPIELPRSVPRNFTDRLGRALASGFFLLHAAFLPGVLAAEDPQRAKVLSTLAEMSLEELTNLTITSVSKKEQKASEAPAAVYVITQEDIRRSGVLSIPEALRMVPGMDVARINANQWAISSRGFNSIYANKLLVLMDGRSVYSPLFAGVHWDVQDTLLEDLDRIEVIRGPGATLWGANAVNGVINIITKTAKNTQGALITGGAGSEERGFGGIRYGGKINDRAYYRVYGTYFNRDDSVDAAGRDARDDWDVFRTGFRLDWQPTSENAVTLLGDYYTGETHGLFPTSFLALAPRPTFENDIRGWNLLARWKHTFSESSEMELQTYFDRTERLSPEFSLSIDTFDIDGQHRFEIGDRNEAIWGLGYRLIDDRDLGGTFASFSPDSATRQIFSAFVQDEIKIVEDRLRLTLGTKFEHNDYTGFEIQPGARLLFTPHPQHTFWSSVARAVRTPSRVESDARATIAYVPGAGGPATQLDLVGNRDMQSEDLVAYELGYRLQPVSRVSLDLAGFYNVYDRLQTLEPRLPAFVLNPPPPRLVVPLQFSNTMEGETYGVEISSRWQVTDFWMLNAGYTWLKMQLHLDPSSRDMSSALAEQDSPQHQIHLRSYVDLPYHLEFDTAVYYVDNLAHQRVQSYVRLDVRLGWRPTQNFAASLGFQDLLDNQHPEFGSFQGIGSSELQRSVYGKLTWQF
ncbi:MAG: TonB-dependent receptor [Verrucomicrobia bacterium]|nr:TonB-dependent receptor [Verrucomicrobiota bacterium]